MAESTAQSRAPLRFSAAVARGLRESAAIALAVLALVLLVALLSFDARDPGFSSTGEGAAVHNRVGPDRRLAGRCAAVSCSAGPRTCCR